MTLDLAPGTPDWCARVTASKVAGILGLSPWDSPLRTWHVMAGNLPSDDGNNADAKARGHYLESGVLDWWLDQHPLRTEVQRQPSFTLGDWAAATPDMLATDFDGETVLVDAKTAATDDHWTDTEPPAYYVASPCGSSPAHPRRAAYTWPCCSVGRVCRSVSTSSSETTPSSRA